jgi:hypothetical protein
MARPVGRRQDRPVPTFLLTHRHEPGECRFAFAAWHGFDSPLRHGTALSTCERGGHALWWIVEAQTPAEALGQLPAFVAQRTEAVRVSEVTIP